MLQFPEWLEYPQLAKLEDSYREREREREHYRLTIVKKIVGTCIYAISVLFCMPSQHLFQFDYQICIHEREDTLKCLDEVT